MTTRTPPYQELADFLRNRRDRVTPEQAGLAGGGRRRVAGLRREELALLAGVSVDYYVRLEQGRDLHPSDQVLDALAGALQLDGDERRHLATLAHRPARPAARRRPPRVPGTVLRLLDRIDPVPATVLTRHLDVLAANRAGTALFAGLLDVPPRERNMVRLVFLAPGAEDLFPDHAEVAAETVSFLRVAVGVDPDDPRAAELIGELSVHSPGFRRAWARQDVREKIRGTKRFRHPLVGELDLDWEALALAGPAGLTMVTYTAPDASPSDERLRLLASLAPAPGPEGATRPG